jgi:hypothetical protein
MRYVTKNLMILFLMLNIVTGCSFTSINYSPVANDLLRSPSLIRPPIPQEGRASLTGLLYSFGPIPGVIRETPFYLMPISGESDQAFPILLLGPRIENGDVQGISDNEGRISLDDVPPGNYYLAVWAPYNWILAVESPTVMTPRIITLEPNKYYDLGVIYVPWP